MGKPNFIALADLTGVAVTAAVDISHLEEFHALIGGTFVGTVSVEVEFGDGVWVAHPDMTGKTAPIVVPGAMRARQVRGNCTAFTSGTIEIRISGTDEDVRS